MQERINVGVKFYIILKLNYYYFGVDYFKLRLNLLTKFRA